MAGGGAGWASTISQLSPCAPGADGRKIRIEQRAAIFVRNGGHHVARIGGPANLDGFGFCDRKSARFDQLVEEGAGGDVQVVQCGVGSEGRHPAGGRPLQAPGAAR